MTPTTFDIYPALSVSVEKILVISKIGLVRREDRDGPGVEVKIVSRCGVTIKACFLGGLYIPHSSVLFSVSLLELSCPVGLSLSPFIVPLCPEMHLMKKEGGRHLGLE